MYVYICSIIMLYFAFFYAKRIHFIFNPLSIFLFIWAIVLFFSKLALFGLIAATDKTYIYIIVGIISFVIGYMLTTKEGIKKQKSKKNIIEKIINRIVNNDKENSVLNYTFLKITSIICIMFYAVFLFKIIDNIDSFDLYSVQHYLRYNGTEQIFSDITRFIFSFFIGPISFALPAIAVSDYWFGKKDKWLIILSFIVVVLKTVATANRTTFMIMILLIIICGFIKLYKSNNKIDKEKIKKTIKYFFVLGLLVFVFLSFSRNLSIFKSLYLDLAIPPVMFERWSKAVIDQSLFGFGTASLAGFVFPVLYFTYKIFGLGFLPSHFEAVYNLIELTDSKWIVVGEGIKANAYVSVFWFLYADFRIFGIIIGLLLFGIYCAIKMNKVKNSQKDIALYCMCMIAVFYTICRMEFALTNYVLALLFVKKIAFKKVKEYE